MRRLPPRAAGRRRTNPCTTALTAEQAEAPLLGSVAGGAGPTVTDKKTSIDGDPRGRVLEAMWLHQAGGGTTRARDADQRDGSIRTAITSPAPVAEDVGDIAVIQDTGDLDPARQHLRRAQHRSALHPQRRRLHAVARSTATSAPRSARSVTLADDDSARSTSRSRFPSTARVADGRLRQLRRQHHVRRGGQVEHRAQRVAPADRPAARRAVLRRSRSDDRAARSS